MLTRMVCSVVALLLAAPAVFAQTSQPAAQELTGTITGSKVAVRSGPSTTGSYPCTRLGIGDKVTVLQSKGDWLQIKPVKGTWSVIAKRYVTPDAAGKVGTVNSDHVWVRASGELVTFTSVAEFLVQGQLNKDDKVEILGESGDFYKITPPAFAAFWIYSQYVDLGGKTAPTEITKVGDGTVKVEMSSDGTTTKPVITAEAPKQETPAEPTVDPASVRGKVEAVRKEMMAEYAKPAEQRDLKRIIEKFKAIDTGDDKYAKQVVSYYTQYMDNQLKTLDEVASITKSIDSNKAIVTKITTDLNTRQLAIQVQETGPKAYNAEGVLKASGLFPGSKVMPKRWVVRDAYTDRITAYVQCTTGDLDLENYVGKHVGVWGSETYDKDLGLHIVEAKQVKELPAAASTPIPPQATTQPDAVATVKAAPKAEVAAKPEPTTKPAKTEATATSQPSFKAAAKATSDDEDADSDVESLAAKATTQPTTNPSVQSSMSPVSPDKVK